MSAALRLHDVTHIIRSHIETSNVRPPIPDPPSTKPPHEGVEADTNTGIVPTTAAEEDKTRHRGGRKETTQKLRSMPRNVKAPAPPSSIQMNNLISNPSTQEATRRKLSRGFFSSFWKSWQKSQAFELTSANVRDLYALERTFLAYNRSANHLASHGVIVAQLLILKDEHRHLGLVCGHFMIGVGILVSLFGCWRYVSQSRALQPEAVRAADRRDEPTATASVARRGKARPAWLAIVVSTGACMIIYVGLFVVVLVVF